MRFILFAVAALTSVACTAHTDSLRARAAFDLKCPADQLQLTKLAAGNSGGSGEPGAVFGVEGCGQRGTYVSEGGDTWLLNTDTKKQEGGAVKP